MKGRHFNLDNKSSDTYDTIENILNKIQSSTFKGAAVHRDLSLFLYNFKKAPEDKLQFIKLDQNTISYNMAVSLPRETGYLSSTIKEKISQLIEGGFFNHWMDYYLKHRSVLEQEIEDDKVVLTMQDHLYVGFTIWLVMLLICSIAFTMEIAPNCVRSYVFARVLKIYYKMKFINSTTQQIDFVA